MLHIHQAMLCILQPIRPMHSSLLALLARPSKGAPIHGMMFSVNAKCELALPPDDNIMRAHQPAPRKARSQHSTPR